MRKMWLSTIRLPATVLGKPDGMTTAARLALKHGIYKSSMGLDVPMSWKLKALASDFLK
jgi:hypothetical protein